MVSARTVPLLVTPTVPEREPPLVVAPPLAVPEREPPVVEPPMAPPEVEPPMAPPLVEPLMAPPEVEPPEAAPPEEVWATETSGSAAAARRGRIMRFIRKGIGRAGDSPSQGLPRLIAQSRRGGSELRGP